jgi:hypothetical protein
MISIVVVYNNEKTLHEALLKSLKKQTSKFELILVNNTRRQYHSAAEALNYGGRKANGKYIMFVHQDVDLESDTWLEKTERCLESIPRLGIAGVAGMSSKGKTSKERCRGYISDCGEIWGRPSEGPEEAQTLDECLLIIPRALFFKLEFDEKAFDGWHCYGVDYSLCVLQMGLGVFVIPAFIYHRSSRLNADHLLTYQKRLYRKHGYRHKHIYATTGDISRSRIVLYSLFAFLRPFYYRLFPSWVEHLKTELADMEKVIDLGCGYNSPIRYCDVGFCVGVELFQPYLQESKKKGLHDNYLKGDLTRIEFKARSVDVALCSEVLEHLPKEEGVRLINKMENWAAQKIIITTPNGYLPQEAYHNNPYQGHKSGWNARELKRMGFQVHGIGGWKPLKGYNGIIKYRPTILWVILSDITQKVTYHYPQQAFQLLAVRHKV